ncbi:MAG: hypothetical protein WBF17_11615 [Phycisphaerae bacterium]
MKRFLMPVLVLCLAVGFLACEALSGSRDGDADGVQIVVAPNTLVLSAPGAWVSVHTNLPFGSVDRSTLELNGLAVAWTKADSRGNLVAKFDIDAVKAIVEPDEATLTLTGAMLDGEPFAASDTISVKD